MRLAFLLFSSLILASLVGAGAEPADRLVLVDGAELTIEPLTVPLRPGHAEDVALVRPSGGKEGRELRGTEVRQVILFETAFLDGLQKRLGAPALKSKELEDAEKALCVTLSLHRSWRCSAPLGEVPAAWRELQGRLEASLLDVRSRLLKQRVQQGDLPAALARADMWLPLYSEGSPLRAVVRKIWLDEAAALVKADNFKQARVWLDRLERDFPASADADDLRSALRERAEKLVAEAKEMPGAQQKLQEALDLWPRLPGARDELEKQRQTYQVLRVAVRTLPEALSPATASTDVEKQALELLFEGLVQSRTHPILGRTFRPLLVEDLPEGGTSLRTRLRRDIFWSDGSRLTAADVRHTLLLNRPGRGFAWRDLLEVPRFEGNLFRLDLAYRQGVLDELAPLTFKILPQRFGNKPLEQADDAEFAKAPLGSGPYQYLGRHVEAGAARAVFRANPYHVRAGQREPGSLREIHLLPWQERWPAPPQLVWDVPTAQLASLRTQGYSDLRVLPTPRVYFLAINQRRPALAQEALRRALAHALDREALLKQHFRSPAEAPVHHSANGPFPRDSWASAAPPRVASELYNVERVLALVKQLKSAKDLPELTLKYPDDDPRVAAACADLARQVGERFAAGGVKIALRPQALPPRALRQALEHRDYDLLYHSIDHADEPWRLWSLFDPQPDAMNPGGTNYLGCEDAKLQSLLRSALQHRSFPVVREIMQGIHAHLVEAMPLIPLWQLDTHVAVHASLRLPPVEALALFSDITEWKLVR
jgi:peptide/nickel transport system substrate-binding protein